MNAEVESIWNEFSARLDQFIRTRVADAATAQDILQDVFLKLQSRLDELRDPLKVRGWLFLVARNAIIDYYRTRKKTSELSDSIPADSWEHETESKELKDVFHRLLHSLPEPYREALLLTEFEGLSQEQLARRLGISLSGAKSRVQRAREQLKELLIDYCHQEFGRAVGSQPCPKGLIPVVRDVGTQRNGKQGRLRKSPKSKSTDSN